VDIDLDRLYELEADLRERGVDLATAAGVDRARRALDAPDVRKPDHTGFSTLDGREITQAEYLKAIGRG
jgi:hypothetical protein